MENNEILKSNIFLVALWLHFRNYSVIDILYSSGFVLFLFAKKLFHRFSAFELFVNRFSFALYMSYEREMNMLRVLNEYNLTHRGS